MDDGTTILFGLPGVAVRDVERVEGGRVVHVVTDDVGASACPACGVFSTKVRQRRTTKPKDLGYGEEPLGDWCFSLRGDQPGGVIFSG